MRFTLLLPFYNEAHSLTSIVEDLKQFLAREAGARDWQVIFIDDGSTDHGCASVLTTLDAQVSLIRLQVNQGYGHALSLAAQHASGEWLAFMDCDGTYAFADLIRLAQRAQNCSEPSMWVGARLGRGIRTSPLRRLARLCLRLALFFVSGKFVPDLNSGLRVVHRKIFEEFRPLYPSGFSLTTTLTAACLLKFYPLYFVPILYGSRVGRSHIHPVRDFWRFCRILFSVKRRLHA